MNSDHWLIYGANGYTGELIARAASASGMTPVLAGRNGPEISALANSLELEHRVLSLDDGDRLARTLDGFRLVLHCAGPFSATSSPMVEACLRASAHYLDITGEIDVFAHAHAQHERASHADVVLMPGAGFDVVPTDCLAAMLVRELPAATQLVLAFRAGGGPSTGTARTAVEALAMGGRVRQDGALKTVPLGWKTRTIPFAGGERTAATIPWGDVYTAYVSTGVPNVEVYLAMPPSAARRLKLLSSLRPLFGTSWVQSMLKKRVATDGPDAEARAQSGSEIWGEVSSADGRSVSGTMQTPNGYELTVTASLAIVRYLLENEVEGGYYTPSLLMGPDFANSLPGVTAGIG